MLLNLRYFAASCVLASLFLIENPIVAQIPPAIQWQNTIGGNFYEFLWSCHPTSDGGAILGGYSNSGISGDKTENTVSFNDIWIVKVNSSGVLEWEETIGGSNTDEAHDVIETQDGGYIVVAQSQSGISGDKTEPLIGSSDFWIIKLDNDGDILWQNTIGGTANDQPQQVRQKPDGNYIVAGWSSSGISVDKTEANKGTGFTTDYWILELDALGNIVWQKTIGGDNYDYLYALELTNDGGMIVGGTSESSASVDKSEGNIGSTDYWVVKLNSAHAIEWENTIGGNTTDNLMAIATVAGGGYALAGFSYSDISGDKTEISPSSGSDYWIIKINNSGVIQWQTSLGGNAEDFAFGIDETCDLGFIVSGTSYSGATGDKTEASLGSGDMWAVKLNAQGVMQWQNAIGGNALDNCRAVFQSPADSSFILAGMSTTGISGDKTEANMGAVNTDDYWILKLYRDCYPVAEICNNMDDNCNGLKDDGLPFFDYYTDADIDGYGDIAAIPVNWCAAIIGKVTDHTDCNDANAAINPGTPEICNAIDDNCSGLADEGLVFLNYYPDADGDNYGDISATAINSCTEISGYVTENSDCNDANNNVHPGGTEICNGLDDNCSGAIDEGTSPSISISAGGATTFCQGGSVVLSATHTGATLQWKKDGSNIAGATSVNYTVTKKGNYTCTSTNPCGTATSTGIYVTVNKNPTASITAGGATTFCAGGSVTLTEAAQAGCTYQWYKGASAIAGATSLNYVATMAGNYKCRVTKVATGCYKNSNSISVSVPCKENEELSADNSLIIYPNPTNGTFIISGIASNTSSQIIIYNAIGEIVYMSVIQSTGEFTQSVELKNIPPGIYFIRVGDEISFEESKLAVE